MARLARIALAIVAIAAGLAIAEFGLRAAGYRYSPIKIGSGINSDHREQHAFQDRHLVYDPDLIWRPLSGQFSPFNPQGFRGLPIETARQPGGFRIIALGDSNTFGWDVDEGANWPAQLQRLFDASHPGGTEVINGGVWGYTLFQGLGRFKEVIPLSPDLVLISFGGNDGHQVRVPDAEYVKRHNRIERVTRATRQLRLAQLLVAGWDRVGMATSASGTLVARVSLDDYTSHLREIITIARERRIRIVLLTRPYIGSDTNPASWKTHAPKYNEATIAIGRAENVQVIDIYGAFRDRGTLFDDESHFGVEGHRQAAQVIHAEIRGVPTTAAQPGTAHPR